MVASMVASMDDMRARVLVRRNRKTPIQKIYAYWRSAV